MSRARDISSLSELSDNKTKLLNQANAIALHATRTGSSTGVYDGQYIKWNNVIVSNSAYNASTGLFTVVTAGKYFVTAHNICQPVGSSYMYLYKNGVSQSYSHANLSGTWNHLTVSGIVSCNVGDTFGVGVGASTTHYANDHNGYTVMYLGA